ncbi:MAG: hypothetical protein R2838_13770 [Caldilineaceae bacterium]
MGLSMRYYAPWSGGGARRQHRAGCTRTWATWRASHGGHAAHGGHARPAYRSDDTGAEIIARSSRSADGKVLLPGILFQTSAPASATKPTR